MVHLVFGERVGQGHWSLFFAFLALVVGCGVVGGAWAQNQVGVWPLSSGDGHQSLIQPVVPATADMHATAVSTPAHAPTQSSAAQQPITSRAVAKAGSQTAVANALFEWVPQQQDISNGFQTTDVSGTGVDVSVSFPDAIADDETFTGSGAATMYVGTGESFGATDQYFYWRRASSTNDARTAELVFSRAVANIRFRLNDIDGLGPTNDFRDVIEIRAYRGNDEKPVVITPATDDSPVVTSTSPAVVQSNVIATNPEIEPDDAEASALIEIASMVDRLTIAYSNPLEDSKSHILYMTNVVFQTASEVNFLKSVSLDDAVTGKAGVVDAGDEINYTFSLENTGSANLTNISLTDDLTTGFTGENPFPTPVFDADQSTNNATASTIPVGETAVFEATYTLDQSDVDRGSIANQAVVNADELGAGVLSDDPADATNRDSDGDGNPDDPTLLVLSRNPGYTLVKSANTDGLSDPIAVGDQITYAFEVANTGNVMLSDIKITDAMLGGLVGTINALAPSATEIVRATYAITQADLDAGQVQNTAKAAAKDPDGVVLADISSDAGTDKMGQAIADPLGTDTNGDGVADNDPTMINLAGEPALEWVRLADQSKLQTPPQAGDEIVYQYNIENTGNVALTEIEIIDPSIDDAKPVATIAQVGAGKEDSSVEVIHRLTQENIDDGLTNAAYARSAELTAPQYGREVVIASPLPAVTYPIETLGLWARVVMVLMLFLSAVLVNRLPFELMRK